MAASYSTLLFPLPRLIILDNDLKVQASDVWFILKPTQHSFPPMHCHHFSVSLQSCKDRFLYHTCIFYPSWLSCILPYSIVLTVTVSRLFKSRVHLEFVGSKQVYRIYYGKHRFGHSKS